MIALERSSITFHSSFVTFFQGIKARPLDQRNMLEWAATIEGLKETIWEGKWDLKFFWGEGKRKLIKGTT